MVQGLMAADTEQLLPTIEAMKPYRRWTHKLLHEVLDNESPESENSLRASLALLHTDDSQVEPLKKQLLTVPTETG